MDDTRHLVTIVQHWQEAVNNQEVEAVLALSRPDITIIGPRGTGYGHELLRDWVSRAGLSLTTHRLFAHNDTVVVAQHGVWRSVETGELIGERQVASWFRVADGRVTQVARYDSLDDALGAAGLSYDDEAVFE